MLKIKKFNFKLQIKRDNCIHISSKHFQQTINNYLKMVTIICGEKKKGLLSRSVSQAHWSFLKKRCRLISSTPFRPNLTSLYKIKQKITLTYSDLLHIY